MQALKIVKIIRLNQREGLIRARLAGFAQATGDILVFLDSHIEASQGWLEPLIDPIVKNRTTVVTPLIDSINDQTLEYRIPTSTHINVGGFTWDLRFTWHSLPKRDKQLQKHYLDPARSPTMAGGLFAISREYFEYLGTCLLSINERLFVVMLKLIFELIFLSIFILDDEGMEIWGGENLEISFRIWMCGGEYD